jgi:hypothetical protein
LTVNNAIFSKKYLFHSIIIIILSFLLIGCTSIPRERDDIFLDPVKNDLIETRIAKGDLVTIYKTSDIGMQVSTMISERFIILTLFMGNNSLDEKEFRLNNVNLYYKDSNGIKKLKPYNGEEYVKAYLGDYYYDADFNDVKYGLEDYILPIMIYSQKKFIKVY